MHTIWGFEVQVPAQSCIFLSFFFFFFLPVIQVLLHQVQEGERREWDDREVACG